MTGRLLGRAELEGLLDDVGAEAERRGVRVDLFLVGGGAITLAYNDQRTTGDLDAVFEPSGVVRDIAETVARRRTDLRLSADWLDDAVKGFLPGHDPNATVLHDTPHMSVSEASPRYLFVLKAIAARESDEDDLRLL